MLNLIILSLALFGPVDDCEQIVEDCREEVAQELERCGTACGTAHTACLDKAAKDCAKDCEFSEPGENCWSNCNNSRRAACNHHRTSCIESCNLTAAIGDVTCYFDACTGDGGTG